MEFEFDSSLTVYKIFCDFICLWILITNQNSKTFSIQGNCNNKTIKKVFFETFLFATVHPNMCLDIRVVTCGPNEALIISGVFYSPPTMIVGGRAIVCPCIHKVQKLALSTMTLIIESKRVYTAHGVPVSVTGVAQVTSGRSSIEKLRHIY